MGPADWLADMMYDSSNHNQDAEVQKVMMNLNMREQARIAFVKGESDPPSGLPRSRMFNPVSLDDIQVPLELLESQRTTHVTPRNGPSWKHQDLWRGDIQGHQSLPVIWTGHTDFEIRSEFLTQCPTQQQYINMCADQPTRFWTDNTQSNFAVGRDTLPNLAK